ncbi:hypothetical protein BC826DRAFT_1056230, partial [Russula brevipes]
MWHSHRVHQLGLSSSRAAPQSDTPSRPSSPEPQHPHLKKTRTTPCHPFPCTYPTPRPRAPPSTY